jgi:hypothetical protein
MHTPLTWCSVGNPLSGYLGTSLRRQLRCPFLVSVADTQIAKKIILKQCPLKKLSSVNQNFI